MNIKCPITPELDISKCNCYECPYYYKGKCKVTEVSNTMIMEHHRRLNKIPETGNKALDASIKQMNNLVDGYAMYLDYDDEDDDGGMY